jgi:hypothetical protein
MKNAYVNILDLEMGTTIMTLWNRNLSFEIQVLTGGN